MEQRVIKKEFSTNLKSFTLLAYIIAVFALVYTVSAYYSLSAKGEIPEQAFTGGIVGLAVAGVFLFVGTKKRRFIFYEDSFEYKTNKVLFSEKYSNIIFLESFKEKNKESANILFSCEDGSEQKLSSAFLGSELIKGIFLELYENCKTNQDFECEDELGWLNNGK